MPNPNPKEPQYKWKLTLFAAFREISYFFRSEPNLERMWVSTIRFHVDTGVDEPVGPVVEFQGQYLLEEVSTTGNV